MHLIDLKIVEALHLHKDIHLCRRVVGWSPFVGAAMMMAHLSALVCGYHWSLANVIGKFLDSILSALVSERHVRILLDSQSIPPVQFRGKYCVGGSKDCAFRRHSCSVEMDNARSWSLVVPDLC